MRFLRLFQCLPVLLTTLPVFAANGPLNPGKWEITVQTIKPIEAPPSVSVVCISPKKAEKPEAPKSKPEDDCQVSDLTQTAAGMGYLIRCAKESRKITTDIKFYGDSYEGTIVVETPAGKTEQTIKARRVGPPCQVDTEEEGGL